MAPEALTVYTLCGKFLTAKKQALDAGELTARTFEEYTASCRRIIRPSARAGLWPTCGHVTSPGCGPTWRSGGGRCG